MKDMRYKDMRLKLQIEKTEEKIPEIEGKNELKK